MPSLVRLKNAKRRPVRRTVHDDRRDLVEPENQTAETEILSRGRILQRHRIVAPDGAGNEAQQEADRDRQHHHRDLGLPDDMAQDRALQQPADGDHGEYRADTGNPERCAEIRRVAEPERDEGAEHHHVALREIDLLGRLVDQHETERDQTVYAAIGEPADDELKDLQAPAPKGP